MARFREEIYGKNKRKGQKAPSKGGGPAAARSHQRRAEALRSEYFKKPLQQRRAIDRTVQAQIRMF